MKFTNGYWLIRPNFQMQYATQAVPGGKAPRRAARAVRLPPHPSPG
ncbi:MAG: hypothetical protein ACLUE8_03270 [Lachnospiraceae bacterium]